MPRRQRQVRAADPVSDVGSLGAFRFAACAGESPLPRASLDHARSASPGDAEISLGGHVGPVYNFSRRPSP